MTVSSTPCFEPCLKVNAYSIVVVVFFFVVDHKMSLNPHAQSLSGLNMYCVTVSLWALRLPFRDFSFPPEFHGFDNS